jgi:cell division transport system ATP-binding protein
MDETLIKYQDVSFNQGDVCVLSDVNLEVQPGEFIYIIGKVGSGKTSLLKTIYAELPIALGEAEALGYNLKEIKNNKIQQLRRKLGIVFQDFQLLTDRTVYDNLNFVLRATGWTDKTKISNRIEEVLLEVGMPNKGYKYPNQLSGGEQQRIVIARAILNNPALILADEPTGNLDVETGRRIVELLRSISQQGSTVIMSTHNLQLVQDYPAKVFRIEDHKMKEVELNENINL